MTFDLVIRGGTVVDGSGAPPVRADVAVRDGRIVEVGKVDGTARQSIDADGHVVAPGFIDGHTHMDAQVFWDSSGSSSCWHGITTAVMGNCGFTLAPAEPSRRDLVVRNLERAEDIPAAAMAEGIDWTWESFEEYLDAVDALPKGINYAANVGHSALRTWAMGERAFTEEATRDDLERMRGELDSALTAGAIGLTTSRNFNHETSDGRPVASRVASWDELRSLVEVMTRRGTGMLELALETAINSEDPEVRKEFLDRLVDLAVTSGRPVTFGLGGPNTGDLLGAIERTGSAGGTMFGQSHSRGISVVLSFKTHLPFDRLPEWSTMRALPLDQQRKQLEDPAMRHRLVAAAEGGTYSRAIGAEARPPDYDRMRILRDPSTDANETVADAARREGVSPVDLIIDLSLASDFEQFFVQANNRNDAEYLLHIMRHPGTVMTFSDSGAHVSQIIDSSIQTYFLSNWVRERGDFTLADSIRMLTHAPAKAWGFADRGLVRPGMVADLNVFDPATVGPVLPTVAQDLPGGCKRLLQRSQGFLATIVAGQPTIVEGERTGSLPGSLLRKHSVQ